jgi:hypothetical protein
MCPVKLAEEESVFPVFRPSCEIWGCGLDRTDYQVTKQKLLQVRAVEVTKQKRRKEQKTSARVTGRNATASALPS